ncbi:MAG: DUF4407 domain-containing protein [Betaproteobacteria bacterium]|nr:DUF4407 domain-containing protein [Betaproteobacteria bacterium]
MKAGERLLIWLGLLPTHGRERPPRRAGADFKARRGGGPPRSGGSQLGDRRLYLRGRSVAPAPSGVAAAAGAVGASIVLCLDRGFLYFADTTADKGGLRLATFLAMRLLIILCISTLTAQAVVPLILRPELTAHALKLLEQSERERAARLHDEFDLGGKTEAAKAAAADVERLERAINTLPADIDRRLAAARACWSGLTRQRRELVTAGYTDVEADERLAPMRWRCSRASTAAERDRDNYLARMRAQHETAVVHREQTVHTLADAVDAVKGRSERASAIEADAITPLSSTVLWSLLKSEPGALLKWLIFSVVQLELELLPFLLKFQSGQTAIGRRIAAERQIAGVRAAERVAQAEHDTEIAAALHEASGRAAADALSSNDVQATFARVFAAHLAACAPVEAVQAMMREFTSQQFDVDEFAGRFPRYATVITAAWSRAMRDASDILTRGLGSKPASDRV